MSALAINPLIDGVAYGQQTTPPTNNNAGATPGGAAMGPSPATTAYAAQLQGTGKLSAPHNTPLHVAALALAALLVVWGLRHAGFSFSVAGKVGR